MTQQTNTARIPEYRAYDRINNRMIPAEQCVVHIEPGGHYTVSEITVSCGDVLVFGAIPLQFTGLLDSTGKKIFEGDILALGSDRMVVLVGFEDGAFGYSKPNSLFTGFTTLYQVKDTVLKTARVIGNIYEPHLTTL